MKAEHHRERAERIERSAAKLGAHDWEMKIEAAMLEVELEQEFNYVVLSSLPGDYAVGMSAQVVPR